MLLIIYYQLLLSLYNSSAALFFVENVMYFLQYEYKVQKNCMHLFKIEIFCNIINVFSVTFDQFNTSLLNKSKLNYLLYLLTPNFLSVVEYDHVSFKVIQSISSFKRCTCFIINADVLIVFLLKS